MLLFEKKLLLQKEILSTELLGMHCFTQQLVKNPSVDRVLEEIRRNLKKCP